MNIISWIWSFMCIWVAVCLDTTEPIGLIFLCTFMTFKMFAQRLLVVVALHNLKKNIYIDCSFFIFPWTADSLLTRKWSKVMYMCISRRCFSSPSRRRSNDQQQSKPIDGPRMTLALSFQLLNWLHMYVNFNKD